MNEICIPWLFESLIGKDDYKSKFESNGFELKFSQNASEFIKDIYSHNTIVLTRLKIEPGNNCNIPELIDAKRKYGSPICEIGLELIKYLRRNEQYKDISIIASDIIENNNIKNNILINKCLRYGADEYVNLKKINPNGLFEVFYSYA